MKTFLSITAAATLLAAAVGPAAASPAAAPASGVPGCVPGMTAPTAGVCSLPGFHWASTIVYGHHHAESRWMLLPDK